MNEPSKLGPTPTTVQHGYTETRDADGYRTCLCGQTFTLINTDDGPRVWCPKGRVVVMAPKEEAEWEARQAARRGPSRPPTASPDAQLQAEATVWAAAYTEALTGAGHRDTMTRERAAELATDAVDLWYTHTNTR